MCYESRRDRGEDVDASFWGLEKVGTGFGLVCLFSLIDLYGVCCCLFDRISRGCYCTIALFEYAVQFG